MLYKTISSKAIIQQVMSRFGVTDSNIAYDALEWIGTGIGLIGTHVNFVNRVEPVEINFHKIELPCNFYQLNFIIHNGRKLRHGIRPNHRYQNIGTSDDPLVIELIKTIFTKGDIVEIIEDRDCNDPELEDLINKNNNLDHKIGELCNFVNSSDKYCREGWYTDGNNGCFDTNIESGTVFICYKAYPLDNEGFPLVLDEVKYKLALEWYVLRCLWERGYKHPTLDYRTIDFKTNQALARATNEHLKMTNEQMESFTANWTNMLFVLRENNPNYYSN